MRRAHLLIALRISLSLAGALGATACVGPIGPADGASESPGARTEWSSVELGLRTRVVTDSVPVQAGDDGQLWVQSGVSPEWDGLTPGDVVVGAAGDGFLRRIDEVRQVGGELQLQTSQATLGDAIQQGTIRSTLSLAGGTAIQPAAGGGNGIETRRNALMSPLADLGGTVLLDRNLGGADVHVEISRGQLHFEPELDLELELAYGRLRKLSAVASGELSFELGVEASATGAVSWSEERELKSLARRHVFTQMVGWLPIVEVVTVRFFVGLEMEADGGIEASASASTRALVEVGGTFQDGHVEPRAWITASADASQPQWSQWANGRVRVYVRPELDVALYGVVGPGLSVEPWTELTADQSADAGGAETGWSLDAGVHGEAVFRMGLFGAEKTYSKGILDWSRTLASGRYDLLERRRAMLPQ